jgi:hypothetical protein
MLGDSRTSSSRNARLAALLQEAGDPHPKTSSREPRFWYRHDELSSTVENSADVDIFVMTIEVIQEDLRAVFGFPFSSTSYG